MLTKTKTIGKIIFSWFTPATNTNSIINTNIEEFRSLLIFEERRMQPNKEVPLV